MEKSKKIAVDIVSSKNPTLSKDTTETKVADAELKQSREQLQKIMDQSLDVICTINEQGKFTRLSAASFTTWGYHPEELTGTDSIELVHENDLEKTRLAFLSIMNGSNANHFENRCRKKNGELVFITWSGRWDSDDRLMYCVARDTTALKKTESRIREERMLLRTLLDILPTSVYTKDLQSRKTLSNRADYEYSGFSSEAQVLGKTDYELFSEESAQHTFLQDQLVMINGERILGKEELHIKKDGTRTWFLVSKLPLLNEEKEITGLIGISFDITEKKEAQEKIRIAKERYDVVARATNEAVWDWDILTSRLYWGENFKTLFGSDPEDVVTLESWIERIHPDDAERVSASVINKIRSLDALQWEEQYRFAKADGQFADVIDRGYIIRNNAGAPVRMIGAMQDISDQRRSGEALRDSEEKRRLIMNAALDAIVCIDIAGNITFWNPQAEKIFGWKSADVQGRSLSQTIIPHRFREMHDRGMKNYLKTGHGPVLNSLLELAAINKDEKEFPVELTILPIRQGNEEFFCAFIRDITTRKEAEEQLRVSKERYDLVTRATNDVIYEWDIVNNVNYWGEGYETLFGHKRTGDKMPVETWVDNLHPDEKDQIFASVYEAFANKKTSLTRELRFRCADGSYKTVFDNLIILYDNNGTPVKVMGAMQDITQRKQIEMAIMDLNVKLNVRADELAASNAELEQFAYVASHDLQEPLRMVSSFLQLLQKKYEGQLDDTAKQYINYAVSGSERMKRLVMDLLEYSRVGTNRDQRVQTDMSEVIHQVLQIFSGKIRETNAIVKVPLLPVMNVNKMQLTQLFQNLVGNAFKYNTSAVPEIEIGYEDKAEVWQFYVKDNGIGIDPKFFEKVFVIFQRLHNRNQFSGTGIGLAICKKIVEKHGGNIWVESSTGQGSTFFFTIKK